MAYAQRFFIYGLTDPRTNQVRYIGRTVSGMRRPKMHGFPSILAKDKTYKANWIRQLRALDLDYGVVVLEEVEKGKLGQVEQQWIAKAKAECWPLTNLTDGGEGGHLGRKFTPEHRARISAANKGRKMTLEQRAKLSEVAKKRSVDPLKIAAMRASRIGSIHSEETKAKIGAANRGKVLSPETRAKISASRIRLFSMGT